jgi:hypothetical protein
VRRLIAALALGIAVVLLACSTDSGGAADSGAGPTCDDNNGPCAPECIPYALCTSEGSTCVIGGAACGHYWICHDTTWVSDTAEDCDSGSTQPPTDASPDSGVDAALEGGTDASLDAPAESAAADGDDGPDDSATPDGDDGG